MIIAKKYEVPDNCNGCSGLNNSFSMSGDCFRCPVLNCRDTPMGRMLEPEDVHQEIAKSYHEWFVKQGLVK